MRVCWFVCVCNMYVVNFNKKYTNEGQILVVVKNDKLDNGDKFSFTSEETIVLVSSLCAHIVLFFECQGVQDLLNYIENKDIVMAHILNLYKCEV